MGGALPQTLSMTEGFAPPQAAPTTPAPAKRSGSLDPLTAAILDASSDDDSGSESDGDPPGFVGQAPPPPIAPRPVLPKRESSSSGSTSANGRIVSAAPATGLPSKPEGSWQRSFEELEDITFSSPRSFLVMALQIAQARQVQLLVDRDFTDKAVKYMHVVCPYRHTGPCPFVLKLRTASEGGWIVSGPSPSGDDDPTDARGSSTFACEHPSHAVPRDYRPFETVIRWLERDTVWLNGTGNAALETDSRRSRASTPQGTAGLAANGSATKSGGRVLRSTGTTTVVTAEELKQRDSAAGKAPRFPRSAHHVPAVNGHQQRRSTTRDSTASPSAHAYAQGNGRSTASPRTVTGASPIQSMLTSTSSRIDTDRALAPPFQRALDLQAQIKPALGHGHGVGESATPGHSHSSRANPYPPLKSVPPPSQRAASTNGVPGTLGMPTGGFAPPAPPSASRPASASVRSAGFSAAAAAAPTPTARSAPSAASTHPSWTRSAHAAATSSGAGVSAPCVAVASPSAIQDWARFLHHDLQEPDLVPLARVLGSAYLSVTPKQFFARAHRGEDDDLRMALLEGLPTEACGVWPKLRLIKAMRERGTQAWVRSALAAGGSKGAGAASGDGGGDTTMG
ncbi:hypothetical protein JCM10908_000810 [Rhodotorula pacifica]|uniref:uncharacterized protein n=1 Tax=Rhodotorula pacifica TaxID=1495444 RepID=UPI00317685A5